MNTNIDNDSNESSHTDDELSASNSERDTITTIVTDAPIDTAATHAANKTTDDLLPTETAKTPPAVELLQRLEDVLKNGELLEQWQHIYTQRQLRVQAQYDAVNALSPETKKRIATLESQIKTNSRKVAYSILYVTRGDLQTHIDDIPGRYSPMQQRKLRALALQNNRVSNINREIARSVSALLPRQTATEVRISQENNHYLSERPLLKQLLVDLDQWQHRLPPMSHAEQLLKKLLANPPTFWFDPPSAQRSFDDLLQALVTELKKPALTTSYSLSGSRKIAQAFKDIGASFRYGVLDRTPVTPATGPTPRRRRPTPPPSLQSSPTSTTAHPAAPTVPLHKQMQEQGKRVMKQANKLANKVDKLTDKVLPKDPPIVIISMWTWKHIIRPVGNYLIRQATPAINQLRQAFGMDPLATATRERTQADATDRVYRTFMQMADQLIKAKPTIEHLITQHPAPAALTQEQRTLVENYLKLSQKLWSTLVANPRLQEKIAEIPTARQTLATAKAITDQVDHYYRPSPSPAPTPDLESEPVKPSISIAPGKH